MVLKGFDVVSAAAAQHGILVHWGVVVLRSQQRGGESPWRSIA